MKFLVLIIAVLFVIGELTNLDSKESDIIENPDAKYFSGWDGPNPEFVNYIKSTINDPDSFDRKKDQKSGYSRIKY